MRCFYSSQLEQDPYDLHAPGVGGQAHTILPQENHLEISRKMLLADGTLRPEEIIQVGVATVPTLMKGHDQNYLGRIYHGTLDTKDQIQLGLKAGSQLFARAASEVEATRQTCHAALKEGIAVCLAGGSHHSFRGRGANQCVFNDIAISIRDLQETYPAIKVMVVDTEAHQGNGTNAIIENDPNVFTYSIHVKGEYPIRRVDGSMDVETIRYVEGDAYLKQLYQSLAAALDIFSPHLIIWVAGSNVHKSERNGPMMLTMRDIIQRDENLLRAFLSNRIPIALLYGSGQSTEKDITAEIHKTTVTTAKRLGRQMGLPNL